MRLWGEARECKIVRAFCAACNANDLDGAIAIMDDDFCVIDSAGNAVVRRDNVVQSITDFIAVVPDYQIEIFDLVARGEEVLVRGQSHCSDERFADERLWRALVKNGKMAEWQVYPSRIGPPIGKIVAQEAARLRQNSPKG